MVSLAICQAMTATVCVHNMKGNIAQRVQPYRKRYRVRRRNKRGREKVEW